MLITITLIVMLQHLRHRQGRAIAPDGSRNWEWGMFGSVPDFPHSRKLIGSVRFGSEMYLSRFDAVRPALLSDASWLGPVRFGSFPRPVPACSRIKRFGSVRPIRFGLSFLPVMEETRKDDMQQRRVSHADRD